MRNLTLAGLVAAVLAAGTASALAQASGPWPDVTIEAYTEIDGGADDGDPANDVAVFGYPSAAPTKHAGEAVDIQVIDLGPGSNVAGRWFRYAIRAHSDARGSFASGNGQTLDCTDNHICDLDPDTDEITVRVNLHTGGGSLIIDVSNINDNTRSLVVVNVIGIVGYPRGEASATPNNPALPPISAPSSEARISARRLADGRVEFALQLRDGGGWGERVLPSARYFSPSAAAGRWLHSSPVGAGNSEARIGARRLADGRIEFALQPRSGGGWGERVLPWARYFPASAATGRWLNSSPVSVGGGAAVALEASAPSRSGSRPCGRRTPPRGPAAGRGRAADARRGGGTAYPPKACAACL